MSEQHNNNDNNKNQQTGLVWTGVFLLMMVFFVPYFILPMLDSVTTRLNTEVQEDKKDRFETVTLEKETYDVVFRAKRIVESYDENGKLTYKVLFHASNIDYEVECEIPSKYKEQLNKDALYNGNIELTYVKEFYQQVIDMGSYNDIKIAVKNIVGGREISDVTFMFDDYLTKPVKDTSIIESDLKSKFLIGYEKESS